ncbi:MAG TPA: class I SAM-dependent methyltransferase [Stellaceae bacterium]|nr:class I SAM-dependent methyltransferase [Stellaceae bacterium]
MGRYWNEVAGPRWVERQAVQEARNVEMLALLLDAAKAALGERVLDIGCGTGVTTEPFTEAVGPTGHVVGADISRPMLDAARTRLSGRGNVTLIVADAQVHAFEPASFDLLTSRLGVMFFADPVAAFTNLFGALKPGGRLCMAVWAPLAENTQWKIPFGIAERRLGPPAATDPRAPGPFAYSDPAYFRDILTKAGFADIALDKRPFHVAGADAEGMAEHATGFGQVARLLEEKKADDATRAAIVAETADAFAAYRTAEGIRLPATCFIARAKRS